MKTTSLLIALVVYGLGFLHGTSNLPIFAYLVLGVIGYFVGTKVYELFLEEQ